ASDTRTLGLAAGCSIVDFSRARDCPSHAGCGPGVGATASAVRLAARVGRAGAVRPSGEAAMMKPAAWRLVAFLVGAPAVSWAGAMPMLNLPPGSFQHELATSLHINGVGMRAQVFDAAGEIQDVMQQIAT